jgi:hypothetical protein
MMSQRRRYRRKPDQYVVAVQLKLETAGFVYRKWGGEQHCKAGDWVVDSDGEVYTVDAASFARTYRQLRPGAYVKTTPVWAAPSGEAGAVATKEGRTRHGAGDYLVSNNEDGSDSYAIAADKFHERYELDE